MYIIKELSVSQSVKKPEQSSVHRNTTHWFLVTALCQFNLFLICRSFFLLFYKPPNIIYVPTISISHHLRLSSVNIIFTMYTLLSLPASHIAFLTREYGSHERDVEGMSPHPRSPTRRQKTCQLSHAPATRPRLFIGPLAPASPSQARPVRKTLRPPLLAQREIIVSPSPFNPFLHLMLRLIVLFPYFPTDLPLWTPVNHIVGQCKYAWIKNQWWENLINS